MQKYPVRKPCENRYFSEGQFLGETIGEKERCVLPVVSLRYRQTPYSYNNEAHTLTVQAFTYTVDE